MGRGLTLLFCLAAVAAADDEAVPTEQLIARLDSEDAEARENAAEELADRGEDAVVPAIRKRLAVEESLHVRVALLYALASHGEIEGVVALIESLKERGHMGGVYLERVTRCEYLWNTDLWQEWLADNPPEEFRRVRERRFIPEDELRAGRADLDAALSSLRDEGDRAKAAAMLEAVVAKYPRSDAAFEARPLALQLRAMAEEDALWKEPEGRDSLSVDERIAYDLHHVRDVRVRQLSIDQGCYVLSRWGQTEGAYNAAKDLADIGMAAVPGLLDLLDDMRPTRSLAFANRGGRVTPLRYADVAIQVLNALSPEPIFAEFDSGLSDVPPSLRAKVVSAFRRWDREGRRTDPATRLWLRVDLLGVYGALDVLRALAIDHGRKEDVLKRLHEWYDTRHWIYRPHYAALMAELGDRSKVDEVVRWQREGLYSKGDVARPDDSAASMNADEAAKRLAEGRPRMRASDRWEDTGYGRR